MTENELLKRMLSNVSDDYDKTEGSFFYDAIKPVAIELASATTAQSEILESGFVETASGEFLTKKCSEMGIIRKPATKSTGQVEIIGTVGAVIPQGALVATELITFEVAEETMIDSTGKAVVNVECKQYGTVGNVPANAIKFFPVTLDGLNSVTNLQPITNGYDEETDDSIRQRYYDKVSAPTTSGNAAHYKAWAKSVTGVGDAKIFPLWNGNGTVKVVVCDANKQAADASLIDDVSTYIEQERPIGATVTVESATEKTIDVTATITLANGRTLEQVKADFETALTDYFKEVAFAETYISYAKIGSILYNIYGVADYSNLKVNTGIVNITLTDTEIPTLGTVVFS